MLKKYWFAGIVLCALATVMIPYFIENYSKVLSAINRLRTIPNPPAKPELKMLAPISVKVSEEEKLSSELAEANIIALQAWLIELGSFNNKGNAEQLAQKLITLEYPAFVIHDKDLFLVYVGPIIKKDMAETMLLKIRDQTQVKGKLIAFDPTTIFNKE
jgi:cell division septation protein DedD